jgi:type I restriction enzyme S subunit
MGSQFGTTRQGLNYSQVKALRIPCPPPSEQRAIVLTLSTLQEARDARRKELALERECKAALMQHLFTHGTRGEARKHTEIGEMPESWKVMKFAEAVQIAKGQVDPTQEPYRSMPHVGPENIEQDTGRLLPTRTNGELKISSGNYLFTRDDVLYSKIRPYLNKVALPSFDGTCSADMYPMRPRDGCMTREFLFHQLLSEQFKICAMSFQTRTGIPKINREQLGGIPLLAPPLEEQREIADVLNACDSKIVSLESEASLLDELFRAMLEELMTGRLSTQPLIDAG